MEWRTRGFFCGQLLSFNTTRQIIPGRCVELWKSGKEEWGGGAGMLHKWSILQGERRRCIFIHIPSLPSATPPPHCHSPFLTRAIARVASFASVRMSMAWRGGGGQGRGGANSVRFGSGGGGDSSDMLGEKIRGAGNSKCIRYYTLISQLEQLIYFNFFLFKVHAAERLGRR